VKKTCASLFTGGGIADLGFVAAGLEHAWGLELDAPTAEVANANIGNVKCMNILDANPYKFEAVDFLHASPVCKAFSNANINRGERQLDKDCALKVCEFIKVLKPQYFSLENVEAYGKSEAFGYIQETLNSLGYWSNWQVVNAADYGVPQSRRRLILRAVKDGFIPSLPAKEKHVGWYDAIADLLPNLPDTELAEWQIKRLPQEIKDSVLIGDMSGSFDFTVRKKDQPSGVLTETNCSRVNQVPRAFLVHPTDQRTMPVIDALSPSFTLTTNQGGNRIKALLIENTGARSDRALYIREAGEPCWTIRAMGQDGHWHRANALLEHGRIVALDFHCLARLQSIPDDYIWADNKLITNTKIIGNAYPTLMAEKITRNLCNLI